MSYIGMCRVQSLFWVWLKNQSNRNGPTKFNVTSSNEYKSTVWTTEKIFCRMVIAMTFNVFCGGKIGVNLYQSQNLQPKAVL